MHVRHQDRGSLSCGSTADSFSQGDVNARRFSLKRAEHQLIAFQEVKARPVHVRQRVIDQRGKIGRVGDEVSLGFEQAFGLCREFRVQIRFHMVTGV